MASNSDARALFDDAAKSLTLLVSDVLAFNPNLTNEQRDILVATLRHAVTSVVTGESEKVWFEKILDAGLEVTMPYGAGSQMDYCVLVKAGE